MSCTQPPSTRADEEPQRAGQVAELRGEGGADQRARARDRGEVVAEHDPADASARSRGRCSAAPPALRAWRRAESTFAAIQAL